LRRVIGTTHLERLERMDRVYTIDDAKFFLENYKNLQIECNDFLLNTYQPGDKNEVSTQKTGRENERNIIKNIDT